MFVQLSQNLARPHRTNSFSKHFNIYLTFKYLKIVSCRQSTQLTTRSSRERGSNSSSFFIHVGRTGSHNSIAEPRRTLLCVVRMRVVTCR